MMELHSLEKKAIKLYLSAGRPHREPRDIVNDCRTSMISIMKSVLMVDYGYSSRSPELRNPVKSIFESDFFGTKTGRKFTPHNQSFQNAKNYIHIITGSRNDQEYEVTDESSFEQSRQCLNALEQLLRWYFSTYKRYYVNSASNLPVREKEKVADLFRQDTVTHETITERETYYVILLIDSSQSMLWPYLEDRSNMHRTESDDYRNAIVKVQKAMKYAHEKAINALRGSSICRDGYMKIYQYTFNHEIIHLNDPEKLLRSPHGAEKVVKIDENIYFPDGMTALYDVIDEALKVVYNKYLLPKMKSKNQIDKVVIGVITDGEDTVTGGIVQHRHPTDYESEKARKLASIITSMNKLRGEGDPRKSFLISCVLIGLTGSDFKEDKLKEIKRELLFDEYVSISQADEQSLRRSFKLFSTNAINV